MLKPINEIQKRRTCRPALSNREFDHRFGRIVGLDRKNNNPLTACMWGIRISVGIQAVAHSKIHVGEQDTASQSLMVPTLDRCSQFRYR
jgi:hypothetical protein